MFDIRHISQVVAGAAVGVLALGLVTLPGAAGTMPPLPVGGAGASVQAQTATRKATGTLRVVANRAGGYTVVGDGVRRRANSSRTFRVPPGTYAVTAPGAGVRPRKAQVRKGHTAMVTVTFPTVAAGANHTCALRANGTIKCWGDNFSGSLGNGTKKNSDTPVLVKGIRTATAIAAGTHACAVLAAGTVKCWGQNWVYQVGRRNPDEALTPVRVTRIHHAIAIAAGAEHTCALLADGRIRCWGFNSWGELGNGTFSPTFNPSTPGYPYTPASAWTPVKGIRNATAIAAGGDEGHTCAVLATGAVKCWGYNAYGQLGDGTRTGFGTGVPAPVRVKGIRNATAIAAGGRHTCAVLSTGAVKCWGRNRYGQLGNGTTTLSPAPVRVTGIHNATAITAGYSRTCALLADRTVVCWGANSTGSLGAGHSSTPVPVTHLSNATAISGGGEFHFTNHTCGVLATGAVKCWGDNDYGQLGNGKHGELFNPTPVRVVGF